MRMMKALVIVALISSASGALLFSAADQVTQAQTTTDVNVINIKSIYKTVWYFEPIPAAGYVESQICSSWGRGRMHLLLDAGDLIGSEKMVFHVIVPFYSADKKNWFSMEIVIFEVTAGSPYTAVSLDVPSAFFYFRAAGPVGTMACLSYYLTV